MLHIAGQGERCWLRLLLTTVKGACSYNDVATVDGDLHASFRQAVNALGLVVDDDEQDKIIEAAGLACFSSQMRALFAEVLVSPSSRLSFGPTGWMRWQPTCSTVIISCPPHSALPAQCSQQRNIYLSCVKEITYCFKSCKLSKVLQHQLKSLDVLHQPELQELMSEHVFRCLTTYFIVVAVAQPSPPDEQSWMWMCACKRWAKLACQHRRRCLSPQRHQATCPSLKLQSASSTTKQCSCSWSSSCPRLRPIQKNLRRTLPSRMPLMAMQVLEYIRNHKSCLLFRRHTRLPCSVVFMKLTQLCYNFDAVQSMRCVAIVLMLCCLDDVLL